MKRHFILSLLLYTMLAVGLLARNGVLLALAIPLAIYLLAAFVFSPAPLKLDITRALDATCVAQDVPVTVTVCVTNVGARVEEVLLVDDVPLALTVLAGVTRRVAMLSPGAAVTLTYTVSALRGRYIFDALHVSATEHLGLFQRRATLSAPEALQVLPDVLRLRRVPIRPLQTRGYAGPVPARRGGPGVDFFGIREYQPGDPLRWINWRISARHTHALFSTEFQQERVADVGLILDARHRNDFHVHGHSLFECSVQATAALASAFLADGNRVSLLVYGRGLDWTLPGYGKIQRERILRSLSRVQTGDSLVFDSFNYLPTRLFAAKSQLVVVSPLCGDDPQMLMRLRARGYQVLVISPDAVSFESQLLTANDRSSQEDAAIAVRLARVERTLLIRRLRGAGIQVVDWRVDQPFDRTVHASLGHAPLWFRAVGLAL